MQTQNVEIDKVIPYARNPRQNKEAVNKVAASLKEFGWQQPIVVDKEYVIIVGHTRLEAARKLGHKEVPIVVADDLTAQQVKAYRIADNKTGEFAEWDLELLTGEIEELQNADFDIELTGFDDFSFMEPDEEIPDSPVDKPESHTWVLGDKKLISDVKMDDQVKAIIQAWEKQSGSSAYHQESGKNFKEIKE